MKLPVRVEVAPSGTTAERIIQEVFIVNRESKKELLKKLLYQYHGPILLFSRTKIGASKIARFIRELGHRAAEIHSDRSLPQRREALEGFKTGKYRILVATDIAARGIDVIGIEVVINYDLPEDIENYVHRIGRTGRAGHEGRAISFATPDQGMDVKSIEKLIKTDLRILEHPDLPREKFFHPKQHIPSARGGMHRQRHGQGPSRHYKPDYKKQWNKRSAQTS
ncbi:MAG: C-terminal helicase domain-containing protein, partial [Candidatus Omnitrophota bacterium]|nr:C-terminal helicase domain-containing protein [Candidatus Omnitrophota bacterium]